MNMVWIAALLTGSAAAAWIARPLLRKGDIVVNEGDATISVYRDQFDEIRRDFENGLIDKQEFDAAEAEIEARTLSAARSLGAGVSVSRPLPLAATGLFIAVAAGSILTYGSLGTPQAPDLPLAARRMQVLEQQAAAGDIGSRVELLIEKTKKNPASFEDWWMLGRSYSATGDHASAADAYRKAAELSGDRPGVLSAYAESLTLANGNKVPKAARLVFEQVLSKTPDPRARYYIALAKAQDQDFKAALDDWAQLARESDANAPWMSLVRRDIANMARFLKVDVKDYLPDATPEEIAKAGGKAPSPTDEKTARGRILELEMRLTKEPKDYKGWIELAQLRASVGDNEAAAVAISSARENFAAAPFVLGKIDEASRALGLDLVAETPKVAGPGAEDIAAASKMSDADRNAMVEGMVAGLAAKLEENPDNPDGWIMLIRSYSVLGKPEKAKTAYDDAVEHFAGNEAVLAKLRNDAGELVGVQ